MATYYLRETLTPDPRIELTEEHRKIANIGERYWANRLADVPDTCTHKQKVVNYVRTMHLTESTGLGAIFYGDHGSGKTSLAVIVMREAMRRGGQAFFYPCSQVESANRNRDAVTTSSGVPVFTALTRCQFVVLDDLGTERQEDWNRSKTALRSVLELRYNASLPTFITTNWKVDDLASFDPTLAHRFAETMLMIDVDGVNWRGR